MNTSNIEKWHFELTKDACNYLLGLGLDGKEKATASSLWGYEIEGDKDTRRGRYEYNH